MLIYTEENWAGMQALLNSDTTKVIYYIESGYQSVITKDDTRYIVTRISTTTDSNNVMATRQGISETSLLEAYNATINVG